MSDGWRHWRHPVHSHRERRRRQGQGISILIPFRSDGSEERENNFYWLTAYWRRHLPRAQIVVGQDFGTPFSKTSAVNYAFRRATGDVVAIIDADCYIDHEVVRECARRIREARNDGHRLWFVPYRRFYRLTQRTTDRILAEWPPAPPAELGMACPPDPRQVQDTSGSTHGHWFGALIQIMPREAFAMAGGMDERFRGWGSEDVSFMRAVDTLYARHKTIRGCVYHLWHPKIGDEWVTRRWAGQVAARVNERLGERYRLAIGDPQRMRALVFEEWDPAVIWPARGGRHRRRGR